MRGVMWHNNSVGLALVPRSGSHTLFSLILKHFDPQARQESWEPHQGKRWHPVMNLQQGMCDLSVENVPGEVTLAVVVRDPVERFRSACARLQKPPAAVIAENLDDVHTWTLDSMGLLSHPQAKYFLFSQLTQCAEFLGLPTPLPQMNEEPVKPELSNQELQFVVQHYARDIALFNSLNNI
jgi:hypothetical protein